MSTSLVCSAAAACGIGGLDQATFNGSIFPRTSLQADNQQQIRLLLLPLSSGTLDTFRQTRL